MPQKQRLVYKTVLVKLVLLMLPQSRRLMLTFSGWPIANLVLPHNIFTAKLALIFIPIAELMLCQ